jgi:adenosyl cobinamide kinase/adenosyl cobinamide phosphate guanylyltransferase
LGGVVPFTLITGGASSGKSAFALQLFHGRRDVSFIATGIKTDPEMERRIDAHRRERPREWETIEEPLDIIDAAGKMNPRNGFLIIDCLTFWVSNLLLSKHCNSEQIIERAVDTARYLKELDRTALVITNELGMGIIPASRETRDYRKIAGEVNQRFARESKEAYFVVSGIGMRLK